VHPAVVFAVAALALAGTGAGAGTPPTAVCNDGTLSYARHHQGACSHHGGVRRWLGGSAPVSTPSNPSTGAPVLLAPRTRSRGCRLGPLPDRSCSPGAYSSRLTKAVICARGFHTSQVRNVSESEKHAVEQEYGLRPRPYGSSLEIDHIVPLALGGSNAIANLYPERAGYHVKDRLEDRLAALVCGGRIDLMTARRQIAANWEKLYRRVFGRTPAV
jgi:hypothetical protein